MKFRNVVPAVGLAGLFAAYAQTAPPATPPAAPDAGQAVPTQVAPVPANPIPFAVKLTPGMMRSYKITVDQKGSLSIPGSGQAMPIDAKMTAFAKLIVDKANPDGTYAARYKVGGLKMTSSSPIPMPPMPESIEMKGVIGTDGTFVPTESADGKPAQSGLGMSPQQMLSGLFRNLSAIPPKAVAVGDSWSTSVPMPTDSTGKGVITVQNKVIGLDTVGKDQVARLQRDMQGPLDMSVTSPMPVSIKGTIKGTGISKVSVTTGQALQDDSKMHLSLSIQAANAGGNGETQTMGMEMDVISKVESSTTDVKAADAKPSDAKAKNVSK